MKHFTQLKSLFVLAIAVLCSQGVAYAQETGEEVPEVTTVYTNVERVTSGKTYVVGIFTSDGDWYAASAPSMGGWYPVSGRAFCQNPFQLKEGMKIVLKANESLPAFVITEDENGFLLHHSGNAYLSINKPMDDGKDDGKGDGKDDGKDDGKEPINEYVFLSDTVTTSDNYWDITYDANLGGFVLKHKATNVTVGVDYEDLSYEENGEVIKNYIWRLAPYLTLPEELTAPIYLFELQETQSGVNTVDTEDLNAPIAVYNISGVQVGSSLDNLKSGLYIVKQGKSVKKVLIK